MVQFPPFFLPWCWLLSGHPLVPLTLGRGAGGLLELLLELLVELDAITEWCIGLWVWTVGVCLAGEAHLNGQLTYSLQDQPHTHSGM